MLPFSVLQVVILLGFYLILVCTLYESNVILIKSGPVHVLLMCWKGMFHVGKKVVFQSLLIHLFHVFEVF